MRELVYQVREGDTLASIAERHGIDDWEDLWQHNAAALAGRFDSPDLLAPVDKHGIGPVELHIPDDEDHRLGRELLAARKVPLDEYLGGASWLDPRGLVSLTLLDEAGRPTVPDGARVSVHDPVLGKTFHGVARGGHVALRLPRKKFELSVSAFPEFDERLGFFRERAELGDTVASVVRAEHSPARAPDTGRSACASAPVDFAGPPRAVTEVVERGDDPSWDQVDDDAVELL